MFDEGVSASESKAVLDGLTQVLNIANAPHLQISNLGRWRGAGWLVNVNHLTEWNSVDWYVRYAEQQSRKGQLHGGKLLQLLYSEPWQESQPHYDIMVTSRDIYDDDCSFCIGLAIHGFGTIISTSRFRVLSDQDAYDCVVTETMHEVGHVFGLVPGTRTTNVEMSLGLHCTNRCIMRQGLRVPYDWQVITADRLQGHEFCADCRRDLKRYFCE
jgi:predicted Zn-dependent protease